MSRRPLGGWSKLGDLRSSVKTLHGRMKRLNPIALTHDEFLSLFAPPEHWPILKTAAEVAQVSSSSGEFHESHFKHKALPGSVRVTFQVHDLGDGAPLLPRNDVPLKKAPKELMTRVVEWANRDIDMGFQFARAVALLEWMESSCDTARQIRFLWPAIVPLCALNEETAALGERIKEFKTPTSLPALPAEVRAACRSTASLIAGATLLPETPEPTAPVQVSAMVTSVDASLTEGALGVFSPL
jgi:hypothetical protein